MKFKNVKPGDIIRIKIDRDNRKTKFDEFEEERWRVLKIYKHVVLAQSIKCPKIKRCFSYGDLVMLGVEMQYVSK